MGLSSRRPGRRGSHQAAVTITVAGRVILDADWPTYRRELGEPHPKTGKPYLLDDSTEDLQALLGRMKALLEPPAA